MSLATVPKATTVTVCDLCGKDMSSCHSEDVGYVNLRARTEKQDAWKIGRWLLWWDPKNWRRGPDGRAYFKSPRWTSRQYDLHTECLLFVIEREIAFRKEES